MAIVNKHPLRNAIFACSCSLQPDDAGGFKFLKMTTICQQGQDALILGESRYPAKQAAIHLTLYADTTLLAVAHTSASAWAWKGV
jgi:hypothetical protein